ncbi:ABC transporter ATP-binding protein [Anaerotruncus massiliensis (ex Liu et al. 2021)]|uniref:ABC transporter ATP-binding protein n=2 Tax=Anaerotruncus TaxID=244127 RepID=A0A498CLN7_9FIRM|nr:MULTISPECIES: ABC transporter ATP-binding protein [Anaerotruncus]MBC3938823.1 ABC transporter ATP-binding protein [Anaerotruncus massiliensis (ex Togo et al. 2019)]RLL10948.1 ABC transporter ATP-binding protein [Anaerotruncus massiliensis (ex Liu et al. 2021)]
MLKVSDINVYYGNIHAIKDISFEVAKGEIVSLIGANGAGKSTILKTVSGLLRTKTGNITFLDGDIRTAAPNHIVKLGLAHVPEGRRIFLQMTVQENLEMGAYTQKPAALSADLENVYERFPRLRERRRQVAGTLSGGEQQMLAMGRALMSHPTLLMLDEPSMGLAPILVEQIFDIIQELHRAGTTILLVEQNAQMALSIADRAYVLETGRIVMNGTAKEMREDERVQKAYLGM